MKKVSILMLAMATTMGSIGCIGKPATIKTGEVGKVLNTSGLQSKVYQPGTVNLPYVFVGVDPKMVRLQVSKDTADLAIDSLFLPKSNVDLSDVEIGLQFEVKNDDDSINRVYSEVKPEIVNENAYELLISSERVYDVYLQRKAPDAIVTALREYTVDEVLVNVPEIASYAKDKINAMLDGTPVTVTELGFPNGIGQVPEEVLVAKRRLFAIEEEKARTVKALEADLEVEDQRQAVQRKRASNDFQVAREVGVDYATYSLQKILERFADAAETGTPIAIGSPLIPYRTSIITPLPAEEAALKQASLEGGTE